MSTDSENQRPSFRFRDKFSRLKDKVKDKIRDKEIKRNVTLFVHQNLTSNDTNENSRHGFRQHMHHFKDSLKNKTHYESFKDKIKDKIDEKFDIHHNKTYPKGFYDSLFSPETENDYYLQTALICLWVIALLCIIPTIIVIFLPARKKTGITTSTNMIFFHVFLCELCYLTYVLLAMINVAKDFRLGSTLCDFANYGMYVTIPIMQFALLFLSLERLSKHFELSMTWAKIFTKPYLIQVILCGIWIFLIALLVTFMFIKKQFNFNLITDQISNIAPPIFGDVVSKLASRRHHCSIDGRLSSVFKTAIIILFIILIVKPIILSIGFNLLTPFCCKTKRKDRENYGDRRITRLVTIFLLLNFFFSFPFYFTSMFKSIFTNIDSTKDTFTIILKICFILRITNIIFECLAFYIFERNSWSLLRKVLYYGTCKKCPIFNATSDDDIPYTKKASVLAIINGTARSDGEDDDDDDDEKQKKTEKKRKVKKKPEPVTETEVDDDEDDDGALVKKTTKQSITKKVEKPVESDDETPDIQRKKQPSKKTTEIDEDEDEEDETEKVTIKQRKSQMEKVESDEDEDEPQQITTTKPKSRVKQQKSDDDEDEEEEEEEEERKKLTTKTKRKSQIKQQESDEDEDEDEEDEEETRKVTTITKQKSRTKKPVSDDEEHETTTTTRRKSRSKVEEDEQEFIEKPKSKSRHNDVEIRIPNGAPTSHRPSSTTNIPKTKKSTQRHSTSAHANIKHHPIPSADESEVDTASNASHASSKMIKPVKNPTTKTRPSSNEQKRSRAISPNDQHSRHRTESSPSSRPRVKPKTSSSSHHQTKKHRPGTSTKPKKTNNRTKKPKKDRQTRILEMSDDV